MQSGCDSLKQKHGRFSLTAAINRRKSEDPFTAHCFSSRLDNGHLHKEKQKGQRGSKIQDFLLLFRLNADANMFRGSNLLFTIEIYGFSEWTTTTDHLLEVSLGRLKRLIDCKVSRSFCFIALSFNPSRRFYCFFLRDGHEFKDLFGIVNLDDFSNR